MTEKLDWYIFLSKASYQTLHLKENNNDYETRQIQPTRPSVSRII